MFIEQVYILIITYKRAHIRFMIFKSVVCECVCVCVCIYIYIFFFFGLDAVFDTGLEPSHFAAQTFRALFSIGEYYM